MYAAGYRRMARFMKTACLTVPLLVIAIRMPAVSAVADVYATCTDQV